MFKKGDRIEYTDKGETIYATISKGGAKRITAILDGGRKQVSGHPSLFQLSATSLRKDKPNPMDPYTIKGYKEIEGHGDSRTFHATICKNGKPILTVENNGWGGCNEYHIGGISRKAGQLKDDVDTHKEFLSATKSWVTQFGYPDMIESEDTWVEWYQHQRPYNMLAEEMIQDYYKTIEKGVKIL